MEPFPPNDPAKNQPTGAGTAQGTRRSHPTQGLRSGIGGTGYLFGLSNAVVVRWTLSTPYRTPPILTIEQPDQSFSVFDQAPEASGLTFSTDGSVMVVGAPSQFHEAVYHLSTPFDLNTASFNHQSTPGEFNFGQDAAFNDDGTSVVFSTEDDYVQYDLGAPYNVTNLSLSGAFQGGDQNRGVTWGDEGNLLMTAYGASDGSLAFLASFPADVPYQLESVSGPGTFFDINPRVGDQPGGITLSPGGGRVWVADLLPGELHEWELGTAWDISSASFVKTLDLPLALDASLDLVTG